VFEVEPAQERLPEQIRLGGAALGLRPPQPARFRGGARWKPVDRITVPSMTGEMPMWLVHAVRWVSRCRAWTVAVP
jgi:hypothetical protein